MGRPAPGLPPNQLGGGPGQPGSRSAGSAGRSAGRPGTSGSCLPRPSPGRVVELSGPAADGAPVPTAGRARRQQWGGCGGGSSSGGHGSLWGTSPRAPHEPGDTAGTTRRRHGRRTLHQQSRLYRSSQHLLQGSAEHQERNGAGRGRLQGHHQHPKLPGGRLHHHHHLLRPLPGPPQQLLAPRPGDQSTGSFLHLLCFHLCLHLLLLPPPPPLLLPLLLVFQSLGPPSALPLRLGLHPLPVTSV